MKPTDNKTQIASNLRNQLMQEQVHNTYMIGACAWLLADYLGTSIQTGENKALHALKMHYKELGRFAISALEFQRLQQAGYDYVDKLEQRGVIGEAMEQFSNSADLLKGWLRATMRVGPANMTAFGEDVAAAVIRYGTEQPPKPSRLDELIREGFAEYLKTHPHASYASYERGAKDFFDRIVERL